MNIPDPPVDGVPPWRAERPFLGAMLLIVAGVIVGYVPIRFTQELILISGAFSAIGLAFAVLIFLTGVAALLRPGRSTILGIIGVVFSILSVVGTLGGLLVGLFIGIVGGNLLIAWKPPDSQDDQGAHATDVTETSSGMQYSWQEDITTGTTGAKALTATKPGPSRTPTDNDGCIEDPEHLATQAGPYVKQGITNTEKVDTSGKGKTIPVSTTVDSRFEDALVRVAHGAIISFPAILFVKGLSFATTTILTNGFSGSSYGMWVMAKKVVSFLRSPMSGFLTGLNRFLPTSSNTEQDIFATIASILVLAPGIVLGVGLFLLAPHITQATGFGHQFQVFLRIYAVWFPGSLWLQTVNTLLKSLEEVETFNFAFRFIFPIADLAAVCVGVFLFHDFMVVVVGQILIGALITLVLTGWLMWRWEFIPRVREAAAARLQRRYFRFSIPLVGRQIVQTINEVGLFLLIPLFLSSIDAGVLAIGFLVSSLIRLPLVLNNQFMQPVVASLYERDHRDALVQLYQVTTRLILIGSIGLAIPLLVHRDIVMGIFGPTFVEYSSLLPVFILAEFVGIIPGSDGIILQMTDRQRAVFIIDVATALFTVAIAVPLTMLFGLRGLVVSILAKGTMSNGLQLIALYHLNGYHPFTRRHLEPLLAAAPCMLIAFAGKLLLSGTVAPLVGTLVGMAAYIITLQMLGFDSRERRIAMLLLARYRRMSYRR